ncbi:acetyl esterase [Rubrivivax gelatinosus]|uniref:alpha/beta hydrolase n=3 Tax=Rubrivivax gelatinosus TaxID=28068 RepID=UPI0018C93F6E|nr:alpha/beta hydrolase [Rubrivivax gelatinosus]MBG6078685.1 acetyl esterase [Rubrivivax gelatinosus]
MLDPQARALLDLMIDKRVPPVHTLQPAEARRFYAERRAFTQPEPPAVAELRDLATDAGLALRLYRPAEGVLALLVYFHGGGWTIGDLDTHDVVCRTLALASGCAVLSVDYRLAPEHRFPAAVDDAVAAVRWARREAVALGVDPARVAVGGDSAGGNLAAVAAIAARDAHDPLAAQLLIYPVTDMRAVAPSHATNGQGYLLTNDSIAWFRSHYVPDEASWTDWRASPLLAPDLSRLPRALVITAGYDPLRDEGLQYADALSAAGNRVQYVGFERQIHGFVTMGRVLDEAHTALALAGGFLREALASVAA